MENNETLFAYRNQNGVGVFRFTDRIEIYHADQIRASVMDTVSRERLRGLVFSFSDVPYIDSSGVGVFVNLQYRLGDTVPIRLCEVSSTVRDVLTFTNLVSAFSIDDREADSLAALGVA